MSQSVPLPDPPPVVEPGAPPAARGPGSVLVDLFLAPADAFADVARAPRLLVAIALTLALHAVFAWIWTSHLDPAAFMRAQIQDSGVEMPPEQMARVVEQQARILRPMAWIGSLVAPPLMVVALGALFLFVYRFFFSADELTFGQSTGIVAWSFLAYGLVTIPLTLLVLYLKGDWNVDPNVAFSAGPALLLDRSDTPKALYGLATSLDLLALWLLWLLGTGYAVVTRRSLGAVIAGVLVPWALYVAVKVGLSAIF